MSNLKTGEFYHIPEAVDDSALAKVMRDLHRYFGEVAEKGEIAFCAVDTEAGKSFWWEERQKDIIHEDTVPTLEATARSVVRNSLKYY